MMKKILIVTTVSLLFIGCSTVPDSSPLPTSGPTMQEIYTSKLVINDPKQNGLPMRSASEINPGNAKKSTIKSIDNQFPRLPNPDLVMYVFPHLKKGKYPVPGYRTVFPMYDKVNYAMPGETQSTTRQGE